MFQRKPGAGDPTEFGSYGHMWKMSLAAAKARSSELVDQAEHC